MIVPIPCKFGETALCKVRELPFYGVDWYKWSSGMEYTYFFETGDPWAGAVFYVSDGFGLSEHVEVDDILTTSFELKEKGFPFRGKGYVCGISFENGKRYAHILSETFYQSHHYVECDEKGYYIPGGDIILQCNFGENQMDKILSKKVLQRGKNHEGNIS